MEALLTNDFTFTSPKDDHIDLATYFARCWPNSERIKAFPIENLFEQGDVRRGFHPLWAFHTGGS